MQTNETGSMKNNDINVIESTISLFFKLPYNVLFKKCKNLKLRELMCHLFGSLFGRFLVIYPSNRPV